MNSTQTDLQNQSNENPKGVLRRGTCWCKGLRMSKTHMNKGVGFGLLDIKSCYKATVIKMVWDWYRDGHIGQWTRIVQK